MEHFIDFFNSRQRARRFGPSQPLSLFKQCIHEVHKNTLKELCSGSDDSFNQLKIVLNHLPKLIQDQIFSNLIEFSYAFSVVDIKPKLPNEWTHKYFCMLIHILTYEFSESDNSEDWKTLLNTIPEVLKSDLLVSLEKKFHPFRSPDEYGEMTTWIEKYLHLINHEVYWDYSEEIGLSMFDYM